MTNITYNKYWTEIESLAKQVVSEAKEQYGNDAEEYLYDVLHETLDGHQWVIYYNYNMDVLSQCSNPEAMIDQLGTEIAGKLLESHGLNGLHSALAFWAMLEDIQEHEAYSLDTEEQEAA